MFGSLRFLHNGNRLCGIDPQGQPMVRVGKVSIDTQGFRTKATLNKWIGMDLIFTQSLPNKIRTQYTVDASL
jgi:hypothetical protein